MAQLIPATGSPPALELDAVTTLGRNPDNTVQLFDESVSLHHCVIERRGAAFVLRDLGSSNGTYVNGAPATERALVSGDEIALGLSRFRFEDAGVAPVYPPHTTLQMPPGAATVTSQVPLTTPVAQVEVLDAARQIDAQIRNVAGGFLPFEMVAHDPRRLRLSYEQLRMMTELTREVASEHELGHLLDKVLISLFHFVKADRGVILLKQPDGNLSIAAARRRDGSTMPIQLSSTILGHVIRERASVLTPDAVQEFAGTRVDYGRSVALNRISSAIVVPLMHEGELYGAVWLDSELLAQFTAQDLELVTGVANEAAMFIANTLLTQNIERETRNRERLSRLLSPNVAEQVIKGQVDVKQGGVFVPSCTVFNSDIRGFTRMSEGTPPERMIDMLNEYFELMVEIVFRFEGTLDKFMGDGLMALWGVPVAHPDDPTRAVLCALAMMDELVRFNAERAKRGIFPFDIGIGIHTGPLVAGYVGSSKALSYTVIGDTANTSARLCSIATAGQIIVGEATAAGLGAGFQLDDLPPAHLKGKERPMRIFNVRR